MTFYVVTQERDSFRGPDKVDEGFSASPPRTKQRACLCVTLSELRPLLSNANRTLQLSMIAGVLIFALRKFLNQNVDLLFVAFDFFSCKRVNVSVAKASTGALCDCL